MTNDTQVIEHVTQTLPLNCVSACLSMVTGLHVNRVTNEFHYNYIAHEITVREYLSKYKVPYKRLFSETDYVESDTVYLAATPSLNLIGGLHYIVIETTLDGEAWWVYDPNEGRDSRDHYTSESLSSYILQYAIPREWIRKRRIK